MCFLCVPTGTRGINASNSQAVTAFEEQYISMHDLKQFFSMVGLPYQMPQVHGENNQSSPGGESSLDIQ